jgi:alkaline phosphatase
MKAYFKIYTPEEITDMCDTWANFNGFSGETCGSCHKTANVFAYGAGAQEFAGVYENTEIFNKIVKLLNLK